MQSFEAKLRDAQTLSGLLVEMVLLEKVFMILFKTGIETFRFRNKTLGALSCNVSTDV